MKGEFSLTQGSVIKILVAKWELKSQILIREVEVEEVL